MENQTSEELISKIKDRARKNFSKGYNCSECVLEAVLSSVETDLPEQVLKLATGFGGGVGLYGDSCGAITGAVMAVGAVHGRANLPEAEDRREVAKKATQQLYGNPGLYRLFNQIPNMVKEKYGHTLCRDIAAEWKDDWLCRPHALHCREIITDVAEHAATLILTDCETAASKPFGDNVESLNDSSKDCTSKG